MFEERLEMSTKLRQLGNERFKRGKMESAAKAYQRQDSFACFRASCASPLCVPSRIVCRQHARSSLQHRLPARTIQRV